MHDTRAFFFISTSFFGEFLTSLLKYMIIDILETVLPNGVYKLLPKFNLSVVLRRNLITNVSLSLLGFC